MNIFKKPCVKRAVRTFIQTAVGYITVNIAAKVRNIAAEIMN